MTARSTEVASQQCPTCKRGKIEIVRSTAEHFRDGLRVTFADEFSRCGRCGEEYYTNEQSRAHSRALTAALRNAQGLMSGERIRAARRRLGMTLPEFEKAMCVGAKTAGRWERGTVPPTGAANIGLWLAENHP